MHARFATAVLTLIGLPVVGAHQHHGHTHGPALGGEPNPLVTRNLNRGWESRRSRGPASFIHGPQVELKSKDAMKPAQNVGTVGTVGGTPTNAMPRHYNMTIEPDFESLTFTGDIIIDFDIVEDSYSIFLNTENLTISDMALMFGFANGTDLKLSGFDEVSVNETDSGMTFAFPSLGNGSMPAGSTVQMSISYEGVVFSSEEGYGIFENPYTKKDGSDGVYFLTQGETSGARRIFPCLDDPSLKANFTVALIADESYTCLSNMDVDTESKVGMKKKKVTFNTSPPMSTYLLALAVGEVESIETDGFRVPIRMYAAENRNIEWAQYPLDISVEGMKKYEEALDVQFPLPKIDHIAVEGAPFGGMENWGLITIGVNLMVFNEADETLASKQDCTEVFLHELAHMWYGDLVTMDWWTEIWLNEGFATYFSHWAQRAILPELEMTSQIPQWLRQSAMEADDSLSTHALEIPFNMTGVSYFDTISYDKGGSFLWMAEAYMGEENLMKGLHRYLETHKYNNTDTLDLWAALGDGMAEMWDPWTKNPGHPVVYVTESDDSVKVEQHRFLWGGNITNEDDAIIFPVPLMIRTADGVDKAPVLKTRKSSLELDNLDFFFLNADSAGLYRVAYTSERLQKLATQADKLTPADRLGLVLDTMAVASTGHLTVLDALDLIASWMAVEEDYWVWATLVEEFMDTAAASWMHDADIYDAFVKFVREQTAKLVDRLGWPEDYWKLDNKDDDMLSRFQATIFKYAALAGDATAVDGAKQLFAKFVKEGKSAVDPNVRESAIAAAVKYGGKEEFDAVVKAYEDFQKADDGDNQARMLRSMGRTTAPERLDQALNYILDNSTLPWVKRYVMDGMTTSDMGIQVAVQWVQEHWFDMINTPEVSATQILGRLIPALSTTEDIEALRSWMSGPTMLPYSKAVQPSLDAALVRAQWAERDLGAVKEWVAKTFGEPEADDTGGKQDAE